MKLCFDSIEEVQEFVKKLKGTRGGKDKGDEGETGNAPQPLQPPAGGQPQAFNPGGMQGFAPQGAGAGQPGGVFNAPVVPPEVQALVNRIVVVLDNAIAKGQSAEQALGWMRGECVKAGVDAANYTMDQIKSTGLPKMGQPALENMAKLMNA